MSLTQSSICIHRNIHKHIATLLSALMSLIYKRSDTVYNLCTISHKVNDALPESRLSQGAVFLSLSCLSPRHDYCPVRVSVLISLTAVERSDGLLDICNKLEVSDDVLLSVASLEISRSDTSAGGQSATVNLSTTLPLPASPLRSAARPPHPVTNTIQIDLTSVSQSRDHIRDVYGTSQ